jgi:hypothetical protein
VDVGDTGVSILCAIGLVLVTPLYLYYVQLGWYW